MNKNAIIIGASDYLYASKLSHTVNDAKDLANELRNLNFKVLEVLNPTRDEMLDEIVFFADKIEEDREIALFYFSGHGIQYEGENFLLPIDANIDADYKLEYSAIKLGWIMHLMEKSRTKVNILILDACRNNPFPITHFKSFSGGLHLANAPQGTIIAYATQPGAVALEGNHIEKNSIYTSALLENIKRPGISIEQLFKDVRKVVIERTKEKQIPWEHSSLINDFYFIPSPELPDNKDNVATTEPVIAKPKIQVKKYRSFYLLFITFLVLFFISTLYYKNNFIEKFMNNEIEQIALPKEVNSLGMEFIEIPPGIFTIGCNEDDSENDCDTSERPPHIVKISNSFFMGKYEVTEGQWLNVMGRNPTTSIKEDKPVSDISWQEVNLFIEILNSKDTTYRYRLPTEAEWEYAAKAGNGSTFYWGNSFDERYAWDKNNSNNTIHKVGQKKPNAFGLYDILGNVQEFCSDNYSPNEYDSRTKSQSMIENPAGPVSKEKFPNKIVRGGSYMDESKNLRVSFRRAAFFNKKDPSFGFRLVAEKKSK